MFAWHGVYDALRHRKGEAGLESSLELRKAEAVVRKAPALAKAAPGDREPGWLFLRVGAQLFPHAA